MKRTSLSLWRADSASSWGDSQNLCPPGVGAEHCFPLGHPPLPFLGHPDVSPGSLQQNSSASPGGEIRTKSPPSAPKARLPGQWGSTGWLLLQGWTHPSLGQGSGLSCPSWQQGQFCVPQLPCSSQKEVTELRWSCLWLAEAARGTGCV